MKNFHQKTFYLTIVISLLSFNFSNAQCSDAVVALDGSGDYTSVQAAIDAAPATGTIPFVIFIKDGVYDEKLFFEKNYITLIGESRDSTIITTAELRRIWRDTNPSDWGAATVNIGDNVTDLTFSNMTIQNNFAEVFPNVPDNNDHTFAIRGGGHRIIILNCNVVTTGGDTLSLWNTNGGMFYHNNCYFEGYVDYVAPRGYCYITDSEFFGYNHNASIWHDGSGGEDHKLVIRHSYFDGVQGFALGRHHRDAAFYLLDCDFSETMKTSQGINWTGSNPLTWGERYYYSNVHFDLIDFSWQKDNLEAADGSPIAEEIDALWTFNGEWNPEAQLDDLLPFAFLPNVRNGSGCVELNPTLTWASGYCVASHNVYFGTSATPDFVGNFADNSFSPTNLQEETQYFWRVDEVTATDTIEGVLWSFWTERLDDLPNQIFKPFPEDGADYFTNITKINWEYTICSTDSFYVYFGETPSSLDFAGTTKYPGYLFSQVDDNTTYYWRVDAKNDNGITLGEVYSFTLNPFANSVSELSMDSDFYLRQNFPNPMSEQTTMVYGIPQKGKVRIQLFDINGRLVKILFEGKKEKGEHQISFFPKEEIGIGIYVCQLLFENEVSRTIKIMVN